MTPLDELRAELRSLTKSSYHVYEKTPSRGGRMMSSLYVLRNDGSSGTTLVEDDESAVLAQFRTAIAIAKRSVAP